MKPKTNNKIDKLRLLAIMILSVLVSLTGILFAVTTFRKGDISGGIVGLLITISIVGLAIFTIRRNNKELKEGYPMHDERSRKVIEKASSKAFYVTLYLLLAMGFFSEDLIKFRDVSQATGIAIGGMALLFLAFWAYYNRKEI